MRADADFVIVGAGAAGLVAARDLARSGATVVLVEARDRLGGRIWTKRMAGWTRPVELGAEFIHGGNRTFWNLFRHAHLARRSVANRHWLVEGGQRRSLPDAWERIDTVLRRIGPHNDRSFAQWLRGPGHALSPLDRLLATNFVEGFEGAPLAQMSARTLYVASQVGEAAPCGLRGGYDELLYPLYDWPDGRVRVRMHAPVTCVEWSRGAVTVVAGQRRWRARAAIITVPLGVLHARAGEPGAIAFAPVLPGKMRWWRRLRSGQARRIVLRMRGPFWHAGMIAADLCARGGRGFGFLHSNEPFFPVWWSQAPDPILVGWAGGPGAARLAGLPAAQVFRHSLASLGRLLQCPEAVLADWVAGWETHDWATDPYTRGAYSFSVAGKEEAPNRLAEPVANTIFFAGEATADPLELGTVHGALASGIRAAREALAC